MPRNNPADLLTEETTIDIIHDLGLATRGPASTGLGDNLDDESLYDLSGGDDGEIEDWFDSL